MTTGAHDAGGGFGRSAGANVARGVMVIVGAVIVGLLLMNRGLSSDSSAEADVASDESASADGSTDETNVEEAPPETTTPVTETPPTLGAPRDASEVAVLVTNGTDGLKGIALRGTDILKTNNYITRDPKNADVVGPSVIMFTEGFEAEANAIAEVYGVDPAVVVTAFDAATSPIADTQDADVVVRVGNDGVIQV
jgi:hypothetical protein